MASAAQVRILSLSICFDPFCRGCIHIYVHTYIHPCSTINVDLVQFIVLVCHGNVI